MIVMSQKVCDAEERVRGYWTQGSFTKWYDPSRCEPEMQFNADLGNLARAYLSLMPKLRAFQEKVEHWHYLGLIQDADVNECIDLIHGEDK